MAATLDKDTVVKHSFWILAGCYVVLVLACLAVLMTSVSDAVRKEDEALQNAQKTVQSTAAVNGDFVIAYTKQDKFVDGKKDEVWKKAWETQKDMMTWPRILEAQFQKYKYFGDPIEKDDRRSFREAYHEQRKDVWEVVQPVTSNGEGVVQCKGEWGDVLQLDKTFQTPPTKDDIWLAQEELWVKREMLRIIREANESVARFKEVTPETPAEDNNKKEVKASPPAEKDAKSPKPEAAAAQKDQKRAKLPAAPKTDPNHKIFRNPYWEFDLTLKESSRGKYVLSGKITNISKRKQPLDTKFRVFLQDPRAVADPSFELLPLAALPLAVGDSKEFNQPVPEQKTIEGLFGVEQVLNWRTAAVKRLDDLRLMYHSSRTAVRTLKPPSFWKANTGETSDSSGSGDASSQTAGATTPGAPGSLYGVPAGQSQDTTLSGLEINRYTDASPQVRHMPVAMVVVVDEEHLPELLAAFVNSKLRIQITQYHWQHCRERMKPQLDTEQGAPQYAPGPVARERPSGVMTPGGPGMAAGRVYGVRPDYPGRGRERSGPMPGGPSGPLGKMPPPGGPGSAGPMRPYGPMGPTMRPVSPGPAGPGSGLDEDEEQEDLNLLEVAVYGLASLYERYPPKPAEPGTPEENKPAAGSTGGN